jgi:hypothetical protein
MPLRLVWEALQPPLRVGRQERVYIVSEQAHLVTLLLVLLLPLDLPPLEVLYPES